MASLNGTFDANAVEPSTPRELLPPGDYVVQIVDSEMVETKAGDGQMLKLTMDILEGQHTGRKIWDRLNLVNRNSTAVEIAQRTLSAICHATGKLQVSDSEQLHFLPMVAKVTVKPAGPDKYGTQRPASNEVAGYKAANGAAPTQQRAPAQQQQRPAQTAANRPAAGGSAPPWRRSA